MERKQIMTGRERFNNALARKQIDRPAFDFWAEDCSIERLFEYLGHRDLDLFLDEMEIDIRGTNAITPPETHIGNGVYQNYWGERYIYRDLKWGKMRDDVPGALSDAKTFDDIKNFCWPNNDALDYSKLAAECRDIQNKGCAVRYGSADVWQRPALVRGMENALLDMYANPDWMHYMSRLFTDFYIEDYTRAWEESNGSIDLFVIYSDLGSQNGPLISIDMFRKFVAPYLSELVSVIHSFGAKALFHSCGDISSFIPDIIDVGVDVLDPIQPVNSNMNPENLARYKDALCFHGGLDVQKLLPTARFDEIRTQAHRYSNLLGPAYILGPTHYFQPDIPPENIVAVYQAFK